MPEHGLCHPIDGDDEITALVSAVRRLGAALMHGVEHDGRLAGLQRQQYWALAALVAGPRSMTELAELKQTTPASITGMVDRLAERGLVERVRDTVDRRVVRVQLTDDGRAEMGATRAAHWARVSERLGRLDPEERAEFLRLLAKIAED